LKKDETRTEAKKVFDKLRSRKRQNTTKKKEIIEQQGLFDV
jgi:hypothetical protein